MLTGDLPYYHRNKAKMIEAIKTAKKPKFPKFLGTEAVRLIKSLIGATCPLHSLPQRLHLGQCELNGVAYLYACFAQFRSLTTVV
jgi:hypothetical protein